MIKKVELLAPAGDLYRGKVAIDFGADAIYFGGQAYSLRARASNFNFDNIKEMSEYAHERNRKIFLVTNVLCQNAMLNGFEGFLKQVLAYKPDAFIVGDPFVIKKIREQDKNVQIHISTQQSVSNSKAALFFARNECQRVVLAREVMYNELVPLIKNVDEKIEIETFIHGAVCIAYSGRCMLSNNFCLRDANIGGCAQSCRWITKLFDDKKVYSECFTMSAKDMSLITKVKDLIKANVASFKIEGRMKNEHYIATVVNAYRKSIDLIYKNDYHTATYILDVKNAANRETGLAWYDGLPGIGKMLYHEEAKTVNQNFGFTIKKKIDEKTYEILTRNNIKFSDTFQFIGRNLKTIVECKLEKLFNNLGKEVDVISSPMSMAKIVLKKPIDLVENDIARIIRDK